MSRPENVLPSTAHIRPEDAPPSGDLPAAPPQTFVLLTGPHYPDPTTTNPVKLIGVPICPDLLNWYDLGEADNFRGRVVRAFFWLIRWWA